MSCRSCSTGPSTSLYGLRVGWVARLRTLLLHRESCDLAGRLGRCSVTKALALEQRERPSKRVASPGGIYYLASGYHDARQVLLAVLGHHLASVLAQRDQTHANPLGQQAVDAAHALGFALVDTQDVSQLKHLRWIVLGFRRTRRDVPDSASPRLLGNLEGPLGHRQRDFILHHHHFGFLHQFRSRINIFRHHLHIRSRAHDDAIFPSAVNDNRCRPCRNTRLSITNVSAVNTHLLVVPLEVRPEAVLANLGNHRHLATQLPDQHRLVGALAAEALGELPAHDGLARAGELRGVGH
mmetsp:Transcript_50583/g.133276  ORF Transcript_50583/g.133276 Transcript_50583/m.133276 type:complete len:296 (-) Transcript_50583:76-963(-)